MIKKYNYELVSEGIAKGEMPLKRLTLMQMGIAFLVFLFVAEIWFNLCIVVAAPFVVFQCIGEVYAALRFWRVQRCLEGIGDIDTLLTRKTIKNARPDIYKVKYAKFMSLLLCFLLLLHWQKLTSGSEESDAAQS